MYRSERFSYHQLCSLCSLDISVLIASYLPTYVRMCTYYLCCTDGDGFFEVVVLSCDDIHCEESSVHIMYQLLVRTYIGRLYLRMYIHVQGLCNSLFFSKVIQC